MKKFYLCDKCGKLNGNGLTKISVIQDNDDIEPAIWKICADCLRLAEINE